MSDIFRKDQRLWLGPGFRSRCSLAGTTKLERLQRKEETNMNERADSAQEALWLRWRGIADLYHAYFTGLILTVVTRRGTADAAEFVFRVFRRQQQERFLPGLKK